jgi:Saxitoxin biosynthesis operon protein SxtJ
VTDMKGPKNPERSFGVSVGGVLLIIAAVLWWRGRMGRAETLGAIGAVLLVAGVVYPRVLKYPSAAWWQFSRVLGHVNARVLLTLFFALVLTPVGIVWRLAGKEPLGRRRDRWPGWTAYPARYRDRNHFSRMF